MSRRSRPCEQHCHCNTPCTFLRVTCVSSIPAASIALSPITTRQRCGSMANAGFRTNEAMPFVCGCEAQLLRWRLERSRCYARPIPRDTSDAHF